MHARRGRNCAITISVPPEPRVIGSPALPSILPYCRSSGVHARHRGVYYSRCSPYHALHASHTLDRGSAPIDPERSSIPTRSSASLLVSEDRMLGEVLSLQLSVEGDEWNSPEWFCSP